MKRPDPPQRRSQGERTDATRAALVGAARALFEARGFAGTGTPEIVAAANVTRGALYHNFGDKRGLFAAVVTEIDGESAGDRGPDEVELVYSGLMRNARGAQASAAHWEAKTLSDDDIADLGYGPDGDEDHPAK